MQVLLLLTFSRHISPTKRQESKAAFDLHTQTHERAHFHMHPIKLNARHGTKHGSYELLMMYCIPCTSLFLFEIREMHSEHSHISINAIK